MTILEKIIANKKKEVAHLAGLNSMRDLEYSLFFGRETISLAGNLSEKNRTGIIAEFKRRSPSKGFLNSTSAVEEVASGYYREGASGVSVLTDDLFFGGTIADIMSIRERCSFPILRKDFILDEYQIIESKSVGTDAILLIAAVLDGMEIRNLSRLARSLGMDVLLEIHEEDELRKVSQYVNMIGVNNRNLKTFEVDMDTSLKLAEKIPAGLLRISESGITSSQTIKNLKLAGYDGFLMGEKFMCTPDPVKAFSEFVRELN
jgi:indole-3-glycerol phosphate synthase